MIPRDRSLHGLQEAERLHFGSRTPVAGLGTERAHDPHQAQSDLMHDHGMRQGGRLLASSVPGTRKARETGVLQRSCQGSSEGSQHPIARQCGLGEMLTHLRRAPIRPVPFHSDTACRSASPIHLSSATFAWRLRSVGGIGQFLQLGDSGPETIAMGAKRVQRLSQIQKLGPRDSKNNIRI